LTFLEIAMAVRTLHANTQGLFHKDVDRTAYGAAVDKLCNKFERARNTHFVAQTAGNQFREEFWATRNGSRAIYRIDVEVAGPIAPA